MLYAVSFLNSVLMLQVQVEWEDVWTGTHIQETD